MAPASSLFRLAGLVTFAACVSLLGYGYWLQYREFLDPCPLCIFQRIAFMSLGLIALIGSIHNPIGYGRKIYAALAMKAATLGNVDDIHAATDMFFCRKCKTRKCTYYQVSLP